MSLQIRPGNIDSDRNALIELIRRNLTPQSDDRRFDWLYCAAPAGPAQVWVACLGTSQELLGAAAAFPRRMSLNGEEKLACVLGDFCLDERYRSLGPALELQRTCLRAATSAPFDFYYDFPSRSMMAVYKRIGVETTGSVVRWVKPIRIDRRVRLIVRSRTIAKSVGFVANPILAMTGQKGSPSTCDLALHQGPCGEEFTCLDQEVRRQPGLRTIRTAEFLNWRYINHPAIRHEILTARRANVLIGYAVFSQDREYATIADVCSLEDSNIVWRLLSGVVTELRRRGTVETVSLTVGEAHPWSNILRQAGFRQRERSPLVAHARTEPLASHTISDWNWHLMQGERDS